MTEFNPNTSYNNIITYYKNQLEIKNREISNLKNEIVTLNEDKRDQMNRIEQLKYQNFKVKELYEVKIELETKKQTMSQSDLYNQISKLTDELNELKQNNKLMKHNSGMSYISNEEAFDYKQMKIANHELEIINNVNTELIEKMQVFYNKMNKLFNRKNKTVLDYMNDSMNNFKNGLFEIENEIYEQYGIISKRELEKMKRG